MGGLSALMVLGGAEAEEALRAFYERWRDEPLVIDKWFAIQATDPGEGALGRVLGPDHPPRLRCAQPQSPAQPRRRVRRRQSGTVP